MMKAAVHDRYGSPDDVRIVELERPRPTDDQVLVRVRAASVNRADLDYIEARPWFLRLFIGMRAPRNPRLGFDIAGVVEDLGPGATAFNPGDRVFGELYAFGHGGFAEYVVAPQRAFSAIPDGMAFEDAAALPHSALLAIQSLRRGNGRAVTPGSEVLIGGASGNVGPFLVQIAKALGAEVTGVCSPAKVEFVRSLGADHVIDYRTTDYTRDGKRYDWIVDVDSHHSIMAVRRALKPGGVYRTLGGNAIALFDALIVGPIASRATGKSMGLLLDWKPFPAEDVAALKALIAAGTVRPVIDRAYPLSDVAEALRYVAAGRPMGKVVITV
jgi:NADPH:quinone reductase-like Zn-dependent oxidoreductase